MHIEPCFCLSRPLAEKFGQLSQLTVIEMLRMHWILYREKCFPDILPNLVGGGNPAGACVTPAC